MEYTSEELQPFAPRVGDAVTYRPGWPREPWVGKVTAVYGNIADVDYGDGRKPEDTGFIWRFHDGLNRMHDWPTKSKAHEA